MSDFSFIRELPGLEILNLDDVGVMESLQPVRQLSRLRALSFAGRTTTIADGDLEPLEGCSQLAMLMFAERRHYSHKRIKRWNWVDFYEPDRLLEQKSKR
ncbi:MAG: hypothetical protein P8N76_15485 [Pirellulaceae bacterium]|nr:hypothetical protein [Pirellulaceae bacterium]